MTATPAFPGRTDAPEGDAPLPRVPLAPAAPDALPEDTRTRHRSTEHPALTTGDPLDHPDPRIAAQAAAVENLLRCWVREHDLSRPGEDTLRIPLTATGATLVVPVRHWSPTGWHRFGFPRLADAPATAPPADAVTVAALLAREVAAVGGTARRDAGEPVAGASPGPAAQSSVPPACDRSARPGRPASPGPAAPLGPPARLGRPAPLDQAASPESPDPLDLVGRVADSARRVAGFIAERRARPDDIPDHFLAAEQALVLGHPLHPTPKSREGLSEAEARHYSPELRGSFPLHWMAVAPSVLSTDSAWTERGRVVPAEQLTARLAGTGLRLPDGHAALPVHPWQLREVRHRPTVAALLDAGLLIDLGPHGSPWHPTSSVRTVHRTAAPAMLKLSLGLRITNSRRENLRKELHRGVEVHRLLRTGLTRQWRATHPGFDIIRDPAWLAVTAPDGDPVPGLDVVIRHNPFGPADDARCVAGLVSPRPYRDGPYAGGPYADGGQQAGRIPGQRASFHSRAPHHLADQRSPGRADRPRERPTPRSRLAEVVTRLAGRTGRPLRVVAAEWFLRYLEQVVRPVLWLDSEAGIALEAHQQNTVLLLDPDGWPIGGRYRDNQGYYFRESRRADLDARLPGIGEHSDTFVSDEVADERFAYYLGVNNVFGLIGAFGSQGLADERLLLAAFRRFLADVATGPARLDTTLPALLLASPVLRCKANLLTRLHGLDELVGPVDTQSVYVTIANPLHI